MYRDCEFCERISKILLLKNFEISVLVRLNEMIDSFLFFSLK